MWLFRNDLRKGLRSETTPEKEPKVYSQILNFRVKWLQMSGFYYKKDEDISPLTCRTTVMGASRISFPFL